MTNSKRVFKRVLASLLVAVMVVSVAPLTELMGLCIKAEAASWSITRNITKKDTINSCSKQDVYLTNPNKNENQNTKKPNPPAVATTGLDIAVNTPTTVTWKKVADATGYKISINNKVIDCKTNQRGQHGAKH